jgi:hypothetical protein
MKAPGDTATGCTCRLQLVGHCELHRLTREEANSDLKALELETLRIQLAEAERQLLSARNDSASVHAELLKAQRERDEAREELAEANECAAVAQELAKAEKARAREAEARLARVTTQKDDAYSQRNKLVVLLAHMAVRLGWKAGIGRHEGEPWEADWRTIVFIDLPTGQVSWHFHDSEAPLLERLPKYEGAWDGHSDDEKWSRCREAGTELAFSKPAPKPEPAPEVPTLEIHPLEIVETKLVGDSYVTTWKQSYRVVMLPENVFDPERICCGTCSGAPESSDCSCRFPPRTVELLEERDALRAERDALQLELATLRLKGEQYSRDRRLWGEKKASLKHHNAKLAAERDSLQRRVAELEGPSGVTPLDMELVQTQLQLREVWAEVERIQDERDDLRRRLDGCVKALEDEKERCDKLDRYFWGAEALAAARAPNGGGGG